MSETTREQHMQWCKARAMEYINAGDTRNALMSMFSDLGKHPETEGHAAIQLGMMMLLAGQLETSGDVEKFILGFN